MWDRSGDTVSESESSTDFGEIGELSMQKAGVTPFFIIKDSFRFTNKEDTEFYKYMWLDVSSSVWKDNEFTTSEGSDFRPCTVEDFDND